MTKNNYKIMAAFSSFILAIASLVSVTVAWFVSARELKVTNLHFKINDEEGVLQLGLENKTGGEGLKEKYNEFYGEWVNDNDKEILYFTDPHNPNDPDKDKSHLIDSNVLQDFSQFNPSWTLTPVSNAHYKTWLDNANSFDKKSIDEHPIEYTKMPTPANKEGTEVVPYEDRVGYYYQFEFYVRATNIPVFVFLSNLINVQADEVKNAEKAKTSIYTEDQLNNVANYIRFGFYSHMEYEGLPNTSGFGSDPYFIKPLDELRYHTFEPNAPKDDKGKQIKTQYAGRLDVDPQDGVYDFDYDTKNEIVYGQFVKGNENATIVYDESARVSTIPEDTLVGGFFATSWNDAHPFAQELSEDTGIEFGKDNSWTTESVTSKDTGSGKYNYRIPQNALCYVTHDKPAKLIVTIWAEGWDKDCDKSSSDASFNASITLNGRNATGLDSYH